MQSYTFPATYANGLMQNSRSPDMSFRHWPRPARFSRLIAKAAFPIYFRLFVSIPAQSPPFRFTLFGGVADYMCRPYCGLSCGHRHGVWMIYKVMSGLNTGCLIWCVVWFRVGYDGCVMFKPESVIRLPFLFRAAVSRIVFCFIEDIARYIGKKQDTR